MSTTKAATWIGPHGCVVPNRYKYVVADDGVNTRYQNGSETELEILGRWPTKEEWLNKYCTNINGVWIYTYQHN